MVKRKDSKGRVLRKGEVERKDGRYEYRFADENGNRKSIYAKSLDKLRKREAEIENSIYCMESQTPLIDIAREWLSLKQNITDSTHRLYERHLEILSEHPVSRKPVGDLKKIDIQKYLQWLHDQDYSWSWLHQQYICIQQVLELALDNDMVTKNVSRGCMKSFRKCKKSEKEALTQKQIDVMLERLQKTDTQVYQVSVAILETALRRGELAALTWSDVNFKDNTISVDKQLQIYCGDVIISKPKTEAGVRVIPMSPTLHSLLKDMRKKRKPSIYVFTNRDGNPLNPNTFSQRMRHKCETIKGLPKITPHVLRHTACTRMIESGMSVSSVQYIMGHASPNVTLEIYTHISQDHVKEEFQRFIAR